MSNNLVILQGWLVLKANGQQVEQVDGREARYLRATIDTDSPALGGRHWVVLTGEAQEKALRFLTALNAPAVRVQGAVKGKCMSYRGRSTVWVQSADDLTLVPTQSEVLVE